MRRAMQSRSAGPRQPLDRRAYDPHKLPRLPQAAGLSAEPPGRSPRMVGVASQTPRSKRGRHGENPARPPLAAGQNRRPAGHAVLGLRLRLRLGANDFLGHGRRWEHFDLERSPMGRRKRPVAAAFKRSLGRNRWQTPRRCEDRACGQGMEAGVDDLRYLRRAATPSAAPEAAQPLPRRTRIGRRRTNFFVAQRASSGACHLARPAVAGARGRYPVGRAMGGRGQGPHHAEQSDRAEPPVP
jgi:hypothetical protein